ncbi:MAG: hypothetical protein M3Y72_21595 [Acidobacteriota bacterium]|nr:hypothetical protein [Acidobacteriota bacterium]
MMFYKTTIFASTSIFALIAIGLVPKPMSAQNIAGEWRGTRSERNAITGATFTVNFDFHFANDGTYLESAALGGRVILKLAGGYSLSRGSKAGDRTVTHTLTLQPSQCEVTPDEQEVRLLQMADLPNVESTEQYVTFFNVAPAGGMSLQNRAGGKTWGLKRLIR